jgi:hypothetical protein
VLRSGTWHGWNASLSGSRQRYQQCDEFLGDNQPEAEQQSIGLVAASCTNTTTALTNVLVEFYISFEEDIASTTSSGPTSTATGNSTTDITFVLVYGKV